MNNADAVGDFFFKIIAFALFVIAYAAIIAFPVMWLWNTVMPEIFGLKTIGFWTALWLCCLARTLFGTGSTNS